MSKVTVTQEKDQFKPITVSITLENQQEVDALYCVFNYTQIIAFLNKNGISGNLIQSALKRYSGEYRDLFSELERHLR